MLKLIFSILVILFIAGFNARAARIIRISVVHTNETDILYLNDNDISEHALENLMEKLSEIDPNLFVLLQIGPDTEATAACTAIRIIRDAGINGVTIVPGKSSYDLAISFSSSSNTLAQSRLEMLKESSVKKRGSLEDQAKTTNSTAHIHVRSTRNIPLYEIAPMTSEERRHYRQHRINRIGKTLLMPPLDESTLRKE